MSKYVTGSTGFHGVHLTAGFQTVVLFFYAIPDYPNPLLFHSNYKQKNRGKTRGGTHALMHMDNIKTWTDHVQIQSFPFLSSLKFPFVHEK